MTRQKRFILMLVPLIAALISIPSDAAHLQDVYDQAGSGGGYDKLLVLNPGVVYTGFLEILSGTSCAIQGNGALIVLDNTGSISIYAEASLDINGCVITGGDLGLYYEYAGTSKVENCTIVDNTTGIGAWESSVNIQNCIIVNNTQYGIICLEGAEPTILYNNVWGNKWGNYMALCPG